MKNKQRITRLEERISELEVLLDELDGRLDQVMTRLAQRHPSQTEEMTTSRMIHEWLNGEEGAHE